MFQICYYKYSPSDRGKQHHVNVGTRVLTQSQHHRSVPGLLWTLVLETYGRRAERRETRWTERVKDWLRVKSKLLKPSDIRVYVRSHLASVGVFHYKTESIVGLESILQCLHEEKEHIRGRRTLSTITGEKKSCNNHMHKKRHMVRCDEYPFHFRNNNNW